MKSDMAARKAVTAARTRCGGKHARYITFPNKSKVGVVEGRVAAGSKLNGNAHNCNGDDEFALHVQTLRATTSCDPGGQSPELAVPDERERVDHAKEARHIARGDQKISQSLPACACPFAFVGTKWRCKARYHSVGGQRHHAGQEHESHASFGAQTCYRFGRAATAEDFGAGGGLALAAQAYVPALHVTKRGVSRAGCNVQHGLAGRGQLPPRGEQQQQNFRSCSQRIRRQIEVMIGDVGEGAFELLGQVLGYLVVQHSSIELVDAGGQVHCELRRERAHRVGMTRPETIGSWLQCLYLEQHRAMKHNEF